MTTMARIIDEICTEYLKWKSNIIIIHLGCGLDSRCLRVKYSSNKWYDIDFPFPFYYPVYQNNSNV